jgi:hypothetical protein
MVKLMLFEEYLYFGKDIYEEDDLDFIMMQKNNKDLEATEAKPLKANVGSKGTLQSSKKRIIQWKAAKHSSKEL